MGYHQELPTDPAELEALAEQARRVLARNNFIDFARYMHHDYRDSHHHRVIADTLDKFVAHEITKLIIVAPPRHGKSELASRLLPPYIFGRKPDSEIISTSYNASLAKAMSRDCKKYIKDSRYRTLFPDIAVGGKSGADFEHKDAADEWEIRGRRGAYRAAGTINGGISGRGANYILIDDPIKGWKAANSKTIRDDLWNWYNADLKTRREYPCSTLIMLTRWHVDDLIGRALLNEQGWTVIHFPWIQDDLLRPYDQRPLGAPLWPARKIDREKEYLVGTVPPRPGLTPVTLEEATAREIADADEAKHTSKKTFYSLGQGRPKVSEGTRFLRHWFEGDDEKSIAPRVRFYRSMADLPRITHALQSWDFSGGSTSDSASFTVGNVWGRGGDNYCLLPWEQRGQWGFGDMKKGVLKLTKDAHINGRDIPMKLVEAHASGPDIVAQLSSKIRGFKKFKPAKIGSKDDRAMIAADVFEAGCVWLPHLDLCPWIVNWIEEHVSFDGNTEPNDRVDVTSQAIIWLMSRDRRRRVDDDAGQPTAPARARKAFKKGW